MKSAIGIMICLSVSVALAEKEIKVMGKVTMVRERSKWVAPRKAAAADATLNIVLSTQEKLFNWYSFFPEKPGLSSPGLGLRKIHWKPTSENLTIPVSLISGSYTVLLVSAKENPGKEGLRVWVGKNVNVNKVTTLTVSSRDLDEEHLVEVYDLKGSIAPNAPGQLTIYSPYFADRWSHGLFIQSDAKLRLRTNAIPEGWQFYFLPYWQNAEMAVVGLGSYTFGNPSETVSIGKDGYHPFEYIPSDIMGDPSRHLRCFSLFYRDFDLLDRISTSSRILLARGTEHLILRASYSLKPYTPTGSDLTTCAVSIWGILNQFVLVGFTESGSPVQMTLREKPIWTYPQPLVLGKSVPIPSGSDAIGVMEGQPWVSLAVPTVVRSKGERSRIAGMKYALTDLKSGTLIESGISTVEPGDGGYHNRKVSASSYRWMRTWGDLGDGTPVAQSTSEFTLSTGSAGQPLWRRLPSPTYFDWDKTGRQVTFTLNFVDDVVLPKVPTLRIRPVGEPQWTKVILTPIVGAQNSYTGIASAVEITPYKLEMNAENATGDVETVTVTDLLQ